MILPPPPTREPARAFCDLLKALEIRWMIAQARELSHRVARAVRELERGK